MSLSDRAIVNLKTTNGKTLKKSDGGGLFVFVTPKGGKFFRMAYRFQGKQKLLSIGQYPTVTLKEARNAVEEAKKQLQNGVDPSAFKQSIKEAARQEEQKEAAADAVVDNGVKYIGKSTLDPKCFEYIAREWFHKMNAKLEWSGRYSSLTIRRLEQHLFPFIGRAFIGDLKPADLLQCQEET